MSVAKEVPPPRPPSDFYEEAVSALQRAGVFRPQLRSGNDVIVLIGNLPPVDREEKHRKLMKIIAKMFVAPLTSQFRAN